MLPRRRLRLLPLALMLAPLAACGSPPDLTRFVGRADADGADTTSDPDGADGGADSAASRPDTAGDVTGPQPDAGVDVVAPPVDTSLVGDSGADDVAPPCGGPLCACAHASDCVDAAPCVPTADGGSVCAPACSPACPEGWACAEATGEPSKARCAPVGLNLCRPCTSDDACTDLGPQLGDALEPLAGARCVRYGKGLGSFCGNACEAGGEACPEGYACRALEAVGGGEVVAQCVLLAPGTPPEAVDSAPLGLCGCSGRAVRSGDVTACAVASCSGERRCEASGALSACLDGDGEACPAAPVVTVTFDPRGGSAPTPSASVERAIDDVYGPLPSSTLAGRVLRGWWTAPDAGTEVRPTTVVARGTNHTLYARWEAARLTVRFETGGGSACDSRVVTWGETYGAEGSLCVPERTGHTFEGWFLGLGGSGQAVTATTTVTATADHAVHARWAASAYRVTYDNAGGSGCGTLDVTFGESYGAGVGGALCAPTRRGYRFAGWWSASGGADSNATPVTDETPVATAANHTIHARWEALTFTVTFALGGGEGCATAVVTFDAIYGAGGTLCSPTRPGYAFEGWFDADGPAGVAVTDTTRVARSTNHTLFARWAANAYLMTYDNAEGAGCDTLEVVFGAPYGAGAPDGDLCVPVRRGFTFIRWTLTTGAEVAWDTVVATAADHALKAVWSRDVYTVTFDARSGSACPTRDLSLGEIYAEREPLCAPTRTGYTFAGWWTAPEGAGARVTDTTEVDVDADHTLYAAWTANTYTVTYDNEGGSGCTSKLVTFGQPYGLGGALCTPVRDRYMFGGWFFGDNGTGVQLSAMTPVGQGVNHAIFARWLSDLIVPYMVHVSPGTFTMGSPSDEVGRDSDCRAGCEVQVSVTLTRAFLMGETEVTRGQWHALSGGVKTSCWNQSDAHPVACVSWWSALAYANALSQAHGLAPCFVLPVVKPDGSLCTGTWQSGSLDCGEQTPTLTAASLEDCVGYRLPTNAEWEYAARGGTTTATYGGNLSGTTGCVTLSGAGGFPSGTPLADLEWYLCNSERRPQPVRQKAPNPFGLFDMLGNLTERTWTNLHVRGGDFDQSSRIRAAYSRYQSAQFGGSWVGFRVARTAH